MRKPNNMLAILIASLFSAFLIAGCGEEGVDTANNATPLQSTVQKQKQVPPSLTAEQNAAILSRVDEITSIFFEDSKDIITRIQGLAPLIDLVREHPHLKEDCSFIYDLYDLKARFEDVPVMKKYLGRPIDPREREITLYFLATTTYVNGDVDSGRFFYSELSRKFPDGAFTHLFSDEDVALMDRACKEKQTILSQRLPKDERLWQLGRLYMETMQLSWNVDGIVCDVSCGCAMLRRIIKDYPESKRADDATFILIDLNEMYCHEDGDMDANCPGIAAYKGLIAKYPDSEYVPDAKLAIAQHYGMSGDIAYMEKSKALIEEVLANCPSEECRESVNVNQKVIHVLV